MRPTVAEILADHVSLEVSCLDRLYVNGYVPTLQTSGQLVRFLTTHLGKPLASPALLGQIGDRFRREVERFVERERIPLVRFERGQRKDEVAAARRSSYRGEEGVGFVGVAQERCRSFRASKAKTPSGGFSFDFSRQSVCVNQYYFYLQDREWGPAFVKVGTYMPYPVKLCLNGHEWVKQHLRREGIGFESLDNGFVSSARRSRTSSTPTGRDRSRRRRAKSDDGGPRGCRGARAAAMDKATGRRYSGPRVVNAWRGRAARFVLGGGSARRRSSCARGAASFPSSTSWGRRLTRARTTTDVDLRMMGSSSAVLDRLQEAGRLDLGDHMAFETNG